ncbi:hypothetical protein BV25DRAFT_1794358 [Artomyces pyxidatus]|uniref:Uncharacterized protein n=1 Tax=Artomyces pyxidatus TaxID=48021 RepID=A0ACB8THB4_9AGAM|nr:hypothetical protein BV25DRAFT_1794358 [Artomyces pyxidatus]
MSEAGPSTRPVTPPPRAVRNAELELTPEQVKRIELNRLKAKAKQRQKEASASTSSLPNANNKRPIGITSANSNSPTAPKQPEKLRRDARLGKYFEYDLSKMVNSKGGFLIEDDKEVDEDLKTKQRERERQKAMQNLDPPIYLDPSRNPKCEECGSIDLDHTYRKVFRCLVCNKCKNEKPEKYSLLTKTECKEDYLLTDSELKDEELLPHMLKANPHKSTFANMMLFCRFQVEVFAWQKWGSPEALDAEWEKRTAEKKKKKNKKFEQSLKELRKRTREGVWQKRKDAEHKHVFSAFNPGPDGVGNQVCHECGFTIEYISTSLEVEQLDVNLFRSNHLFIPYQARGVYGGQVISQALVAATKCVKPQYLLHVSLPAYFLLSASSEIPILYNVENIRDGRSYVTRTVRAVQGGRTVFMMLCSFHIPEPWQPSHNWPMPIVPSPEESEDETVLLRGLADRPGVNDWWKQWYTEYAQARANSPVEVRHPNHHIAKDGTRTFVYWMKTREVANYSAPFQKCILSYMSDLHLGQGSRDDCAQTPPCSPHISANELNVQSSLDHSIMYYDHDFTCNDWILYVITSPVAGSGRGYVTGRMYSRNGKLLAIVNQEGVVRADIKNPKSQDAAKAKM